MRRLLYFAAVTFAPLAFALLLRPPPLLSHPNILAGERVLYAFKGPSDGSGPVAGVIAGKYGVLYGTTIVGGGSAACTGGCGTVFRLTPTRSGYAESILHHFNGKDGSEPQGPLLDDKGALYGVTLIGGASGNGTVFKLTPRVWGYAFTVLHSFNGPSDGSQPSGGLITDQSGSLYGTTQFFGSAKSGTVFKLTPTKSGYAFSVIYTFHGGNDGAYPLAGLIAGTGGALFGTTSGGGTGKQGTVFKLTPTRTGYAERVVYSFQGGSDGSGPAAALLVGANGSFYGTTLGGGLVACYTYACGTVFAMTPVGSGYTERVLYRFRGGNDGAEPAAALVGGAGGTLYGTTLRGGGTDSVCPNYPQPSGCGTVFALTPSGSSYAEAVLYPFQGGAGGSLPYAGLTADGTRAVYGATYSGGNSACGRGGPCGTVFQVKP